VTGGEQPGTWTEVDGADAAYGACMLPAEIGSRNPGLRMAGIEARMWIDGAGIPHVAIDTSNAHPRISRGSGVRVSVNGFDMARIESYAELMAVEERLDLTE
jgi:hypothetical protein